MRRSIERFENEFVGSQFNIVVRAFDQKVNLATSLFWLFNHSGLSSSENSLENNRDLMLGIDDFAGRAALIVGYGLEPFVTRDELDEILITAKPLLQESHYEKASSSVIAACSVALRGAAERAQALLGGSHLCEGRASESDY